MWSPRTEVDDRFKSADRLELDGGSQGISDGETE